MPNPETTDEPHVPWWAWRYWALRIVCWCLYSGWRTFGCAAAFFIAGVDFDRLMRGEGDAFWGSPFLLSLFCIWVAITGFLMIRRLANGA